ncbi:MAG: SDR family oxidoreductase [Acidobacteriia bacterium]|nr:SDR family oxidoreductase [Terriglobia bacterium]
MRVLFIGGTGNISIASTRLLAESGADLCLFNRGQRGCVFPEGVRQIRGDIRNPSSAEAALKGFEFDVVVDWVAYLPQHIETDVALFSGRISQFVFISSASAYQKPPSDFRITESTPLGNPFWQYARDKIACEQRLRCEYLERGFPVTIVRPSYTYGQTWIPCVVAGHEYTLVDRMRKGRKVIVHGDGQSLWTMTHNTDFAKGFIGILGRAAAIGESFHITSDEVLTWDQIYQEIGIAAGAKPDIVHIPSEFISAFDPDSGASLLGDKAYSAIFDNSKIRKFVPGFTASVSFGEGIRKSIAWFDADPRRKIIEENRNQLMDRIITAYLNAWPS